MNNRSSFKISLGQLQKFLWNELVAMRTDKEIMLTTVGWKSNDSTAPAALQFLKLRATRNLTAVLTQNQNKKWKLGTTPTKQKGQPRMAKRQQIEE